MHAFNRPGCFGVGGAPGESVWIKAGATAIEPLAIRDSSYLRMNIDIGNQSGGGAHAVVLGDIANSRSCEQARQWERKAFEGRPTPTPISIPPSGRGLAAVRRRLGIRGPDDHLLHPGVGHLHADVTGGGSATDGRA